MRNIQAQLFYSFSEYKHAQEKAFYWGLLGGTVVGSVVMFALLYYIGVHLD